MTQNQLQTIPIQSSQLTVGDVVKQAEMLQEVLKKVMIKGHHYGVIPGTETTGKPGEKPRPPVLLKPGAEKLCMVFRLAPSFSTHTKDLPNGHREERTLCTLTHITSGQVFAQAEGSCSTMETKYRYRNAKPVCPECQAEAIFKSKRDPGFYCWNKHGGCGMQFDPKDDRITSQRPGKAENPDIADAYNTVLKMANKRALVAATLLATAASDMFIVEEDAEKEHEEEPAGDFGEPPPEDRRGRQQQKVDKKPPPQKELSRKDSLIRDCLKLVTTLGMSKEKLASFLDDQGIEAPKDKWSELNEEALAKIHGLLASEVASREGAPQA